MTHPRFTMTDEEVKQLEVFQDHPKMEWAEGLGLIIMCVHEGCIAIARWDHEYQVWVDEDDRRLSFREKRICPVCGRFGVRLPSPDEVKKSIGDVEV